MTSTYDDVLDVADLENLDSFLKAWESTVTVIDTLSALVPGGREILDGLQDDLTSRRQEAIDLRRKLAVAIHLGGLS